MKRYIVGEGHGNYLILVDDKNEVTAIDRPGNAVDITDPRLLQAVLYSLDFHKEQYEFVELELSSLRSQVDYYQRNEHKCAMYHMIEDRAREVLLRYPQLAETFKIEDRGWNFYDKNGDIVDHYLPFLNTFHQAFQNMCEAYDIGNMYVKLTSVYDSSRPSDDQFVMIVSEYRQEI